MAVRSSNVGADDPVVVATRRNLLPAMASPAAASADPIVFVGAEGIRLRDAEDRDYVDGMSGMMNVNLGYGRADFAAEMARATRQLSFAITFFGFTHAPEAQLARALAAIAPGDIERFFFTTGGSDAIDTAIKLARQYHQARGRPDKTTIIARRQSYHGMTIAATSVTGSDAYWNGVEPLMGGVHHIDQPDGAGEDPAAAFERALEQVGPDRVAAFVAEPISLPTGMRLPPEGYWRRIRELCTQHDVLLIDDEVITGFGRTGRMFAIDHWDVAPDLMVMAKGLTAGYAPLGAVGMTQDVAAAIAQDDRFLAHGYTCGGHPVSCAAARLAVKAYTEDGFLARAELLGQHLEERLRAQQADGAIRDVRRLGLLLAVDAEIAGDALDPLPGGASVGARLNAALRAERLIARVYGATVILGPSFAATRADCDEIATRVARGLGRCAEAA